MSAPAAKETAAPQAPETPNTPEQPPKKSRWGRKAKEPKPEREPKPPKEPKVPKPRRSRGPTPWLLLAGLLTAGAAVAVLYLPIPGLTPKAEPPAGAPSTPEASVGEALTKREQDVAKREADLAAREQAVKQKETEMLGMVKQITAGQPSSPTLQQVVALYEAMAPTKAAPLLASLPTESAVQVLRLMKADQAAAILSAMEPAQGAQIMGELMKPPAQTSLGG